MKANKLIFLAALLVCSAAKADEGMWMVNAISQALVDKMQDKGLQLNANEIYNAEAVSLKDAIVSLDFGCTGSMVSKDGLLITNHHCAYGDVFNLSTPEHNYLEDGYWATSAEEEIHIPGKSVQMLDRILDVTDEVKALIESEKAAGKPAGSRRISYLMEKKYAAETGLEASLSLMWSGSRYYLALYVVYKDVRLVAAPPVSIAAFGGDVDNWEWPQHKCDFAMYRVYAGPDGKPAEFSGRNVPYCPKNWLKISAKGYDKGDFAMIMGYPGITHRYASSAESKYQTETALPISNKFRGEQMEIISRWMDADPAIRLKYSDRYFSLSNVQELQDGEVACCKRFKVVKEKKAIERKLKGAENKALLRELASGYNAISSARKNSIWYRETMVRGTSLALIATRLKNIKSGIDLEKEYAAIDMRVEKELFENSVRNYYTHVDSTMWGPYQVEVRDRFTRDGKEYDYKALSEYLWTDDYMTKEDRIFRFFTDVNIAVFNSAVDKLQGERTVSELGKEYTRTLYRHRLEKGIAQYPDANSTMRITYGTVGSYKRDGQMLPWQTLSGEILAKENRDSYDFTLKDSWRSLLKSAEQQLPVDFLTDNDITGGNSGSPVMNARGELIGLAFDGNKESLASDLYYTPGYNKCVCVDIRFVLWTLKNYAGMDRIYKELTIL